MSQKKSEKPENMTNEQLLKNLKKEFEKVHSEIKVVQDTNAELLVKVDKIDAAHEKLKIEVKNIDKSLVQTKVDVVNIQSSVARLEQLHVNANLMIHGIPEKKDEKPLDIVKETFKIVDPNFKFKIVSAYRIGQKSKENNRSLLVKLGNPDQKLQIIRKKVIMTINCTQIIVNGTPLGAATDVVFFSEQLGNLNARLFYIARTMVKKSQLHKCWTRNGNVYVKKTEDSEVVLIRHEVNLLAVLDNNMDLDLLDASGADASTVMESVRANESLMALKSTVDEAKLTIPKPRALRRHQKSSTPAASPSEASAAAK